MFESWRGIVGDIKPTHRPGSLEEFITEHYWGYAAQKDGGSVEYRVEHPRWPVRRVTEAEFDCDAAALYGPEVAACLSKPPHSAFWADGSAVTVYQGERIESAKTARP